MKVCVIGAGIAGLVTAKVLRDDGFDVVVCERLPTIGGVWASSRTYPGLRANNPRETYAFSDFEYPATADDFPTAEQVRAYLNAYCDHFSLRGMLRLSTEVSNVSRRPAGAGAPGAAFEVTVRHPSSVAGEETLACDFVVVCNGVFSQPSIPTIDGRQRFAGRVLHSSEITDPLAFDGKRIVVVGAGKSALDCATWAAQRGRSCALIYRTPHWMVPRYFFGGVRADRILLTRFAELFLRYHSPSQFESLFHRRAGAVVRCWWRAQTRFLKNRLRLPASLIPDRPLPAGFESIGIGSEFYDVLRGGRLATMRGRIVQFAGPTTIRLDSGERLEADAVIFATGWRQGLEFLDAELQDEVQKDGKFYLYRHIVPPGEPRLGFIGYASSIACQLTSEIAAHWLSQSFRGELQLPAVPDMRRQIAIVHSWAADLFPARQEGYFVGPFLGHYIDELMRDMRLKTFRTGHCLAEYFGPLWPSRYRAVGSERRVARGQ